jgi:hypothetical protein
LPKIAQKHTKHTLKHYYILNIKYALKITTFEFKKLREKSRKSKQTRREKYEVPCKVLHHSSCKLHGLVVMAVNSQLSGPGFEYQSRQYLF